MLVMTAPAVIPAWATGLLPTPPATSGPEFTFAMLAGTEDSSLLRQPLLVPPLPPRPPAELPPADWLLCSSCCSWVCGLLEVLGPLLELATVTPREGGGGGNVVGGGVSATAPPAAPGGGCAPA